MMLVAMAFAQELPWECPVVETPAEAYPLQTDGRLEDAWDALEAEVDA